MKHQRLQANVIVQIIGLKQRAGYEVANQMLGGKIMPLEADAVLSVLDKMISLGRLGAIVQELADIKAASAARSARQ
jgi:hypothetical protein